MIRFFVSFCFGATCLLFLTTVTAFAAEDKTGLGKQKAPLAVHLYGTWYSKSTEGDVTEHYLITRTSDRIFMSKMMYVDHKKKHYVIDTDSGKWSLRNNTYKEVYKNADAEEPEVISYQVIKLSEKAFVYWVTFEDQKEKEKYTENKSNLKILPKPPKGYKEVDLDTFYGEDE